MSNELREAIKMLDEEVRQLNQWVEETLSGWWSTHQVRAMRERALVLQNKANELKVRAFDL